MNIADPMFENHPKLSLGFYYGTDKISYINILSKIIQKICSILKISSNNLFIFGADGGGYASLQLSMYINNCTHIAINPQISIAKHFYKSEFFKQTGIDLNLHDPFRRNDTANVMRECISKKGNKFFIIDNVTSKTDCEGLFCILCGGRPELHE